MFSWMHANHDSDARRDGMPSDEAELDALVDDELDDDRRRAFLQRMEREPAGWRRVALRFLQRQVERRVVRDLMGATQPRTTQEPRKTEPGIVRWYPALRIAAMALLVVGLVELLVPHRGKPVMQTPGQTAQKALVPVNTVADHTQRRQLQILPGSPSQYLGANAPGGMIGNYGNNIRRAASRVLLVPGGGNRVVAYPVQNLNSKGQPIY